MQSSCYYAKVKWEDLHFAERRQKLSLPSWAAQRVNIETLFFNLWPESSLTDATINSTVPLHENYLKARFSHLSENLKHFPAQFGIHIWGELKETREERGTGEKWKKRKNDELPFICLEQPHIFVRRKTIIYSYTNTALERIETSTPKQAPLVTYFQRHL